MRAKINFMYLCAHKRSIMKHLYIFLAALAVLGCAPREQAGNTADDPQHYRMEVYGERMTWASTLADTYEQLAFDQAVGWSRWLRLNRQWPNLFCPKDLDFELPIPQKQI